MKAMILAAGEGTRLRPLTSNTPKPLLLVAGKPFLTHVLEALRSAGVIDVAILVGWKANRIKEFYGDGGALGMNISYLEQKERLGTADAVRFAENITDEPFVCLNGDVVVSGDDIKAMRELHEKTGLTVMGAVEVEDPSQFGVLETKNGRLTKVVEKPNRPPSNLINAGMFVFTPEIFHAISHIGKSPRGEYEVTDALNLLAESEGVAIHTLTTQWIDVGRPWDLLRANEIFMARMARKVDGDVEPNVVLENNVVVERGARIRSGSYISGPVHISAGCDIGPNCYIRPGCCFGPNVRVGASVEVKNSIVMADTRIPHLTYLGDSIVGERCNFGAGTKIANLRFDDKTVKVSLNGKLVDSGRRKLGVIMGDDVKTGINSMIDAGTIIFENSVIGPGAAAKGTVGPGAKVL
ncbi:MAG TPA: bifunctional sugar-1-phosphate nucleotidylyltransferase/acetyltransferase [Methanomassiliicoccales archaeon]|nr:bifunctional sugar-1-phosphate nucleotidylyltransferase/acetyltransferase [Methanomassiliicoccales archaeon]